MDFYKVLTVIFLLLSGPLLGGAITLTDTAGNEVECELVEVTPEEVKLRRGRQVITVKMEQLAPESQELARNEAMRKGIFQAFPEFVAEVIIGRKRRAMTGSTYMKTMDITSSLKLSPRSRMDTLPAARAHLVIVTFDTAAKYVGREEVLMAYKVFEKEIPPSEDGASRKFDFPSFHLAYDADRDYTNIGGQRYRYYIFGLVDPETGMLVDFQTTYPRLKQHLERYPEERMNFLTMAEGTQFPASYE